ncbi:sugar ABC transporter permease [Nocardioides panacihumi]|uniref:Sugar ABC transporter permease n=1 Tax=Nocardioides panacihumi TaxID=400774 RepID=A0ABP5CY22_9ACTN
MSVSSTTAVRRPPRPGRSRPGRRQDAGWALVLLAPATVGLFLFYLWPAAETLYESFTTSGPFGGHTWTGLDNYRQLVHDPELRQAFVNTLWYTLIALLGVPISLVLAVLLAKPGRRFVTTYRVLMFLPAVTMPAAIAIVWKWLFHHDYGLINIGLAKVGIHGPYWLSDPHTALVAVAMVGMWAGIGYGVIIMMAGLQSISPHYYEAAEIDGAGPVRRFFAITVPLMSPTIFFMTVLTVISTLQMFDLIYVMIGSSNPALPQTRTVLYFFYEHTFNQNDRGYGSAIAFSLLAVVVLVTAVQFALQKRWVHYE